MVTSGLLEKVKKLKTTSENEKTIVQALVVLLQRALEQDERGRSRTGPRRDAMEDQD